MKSNTLFFLVSMFVLGGFSVYSGEIQSGATKVNQAYTGSSAGTIWMDNFDSYTVGTFPSSGGWSLIYSGAGSQYQYVDNTHSVSGSQSLHLVGSSCWSANAYHALSLPSFATLNAHVYVDSIVSCGCTNTLGYVAFENPNVGSWGTAYGSVGFNCDGNMYAAQSAKPTVEPSNDVLLMHYEAGLWYQIKLDVNLISRTFDVYVNGEAKAIGLKILETGTPTGVEIAAGHGGNPTVWFDNVVVSNTLTISGMVWTENGTGITGVVLSGLPGNPATTATGAYIAMVAPGWSGTVTPQKAGYTFTPPTRIYTNVTTSQVNQFYIGAETPDNSYLLWTK